MKAVLKLVIGLIFAIVGLVVVAGVLLAIFFDPNEYKPQIETAARDQANIELSINGDIGWSVFPWLGIGLNDIDVKFVGNEPLASLDEARVSVNIPALFSGQVKMQSIEVRGLELNLVQKAADSNNWTPPPSEQTPASEPTQQATQSSAASDSTGLPIEISIEEVALVDAFISYSDSVSGTYADVSALNLETGTIALNSFTDVALSLVVKQYADANKTVALEAPISLTTQVRFDDQTQVLDLKETLLKVSATGEVTQNKTYSLEVGSDVTVDIKNESVLAKALLVKLADLNLSGQVQVNSFANPVIAAQINIAEFALNPLLAELGQAEIETTDPDVLKRIGLSTRVLVTADEVKASEISFKLDDTLFTGEAGYGISSGRISANLSGDAINADRYLPPASETPAPAAQPASSEPYSKEEIIPMEPLQALNLDAAFKLGQLTIQKMNLSDIVVVADAENGVVTLKTLSAKAFGGTLAANAKVNAQKKPLKLAFTTQVKGLQVGDALQTLAETDILTGTAATSANITAQGQSVYSIVNSLSGTAKASFNDGVIQGVDMLHTVCNGINTVSSLGINPDPVDPVTPFANISLSSNIVNGVVQNNDLKAILDAMVLSGKGSVDLPKQGLNYRAALLVEEDLLNQSCNVPNFLENIEFPVICKGQFDTPPLELCKPDISGFTDQFKAKKEAAVAKVKAQAAALEAQAKAKADAAKAKAKAEAEAAKARAKAKADAKIAEEKAKLEDKAKDALKGLFGR